MLAILVSAPFHRPGWVYEEKYDGIRVIAYKAGDTVRLITRNVKDRTEDFPGVTSELRALPAPTLILDGEVVVRDAGGLSRFQLLQRRHLGQSAAPEGFAVFDCLYARGRDIRSEPLALRRQVLEKEVRPGKVLLLSRKLAADGFEAFDRAKQLGLEGLIAKDLSAPYLAGQRSPSWRKVKVRAEDEFVIGGFTAPRGSRAHLGALLIGAYDGVGLRYAGKVGTGFTGRVLDDLVRRLRPLAREASPFHDHPRERDATWTEPTLVAQIGYTERTHDGRLRHPVFLGLRDDKSAHDVRWPAADTIPESQSGSASNREERASTAPSRVSRKVLRGESPDSRADTDSSLRQPAGRRARSRRRPHTV
jgi:bifunctional non-homologous end joining protein LigD